jgi:glutathione S-transferase
MANAYLLDPGPPTMQNQPDLTLYYAPVACSLVPWIALTEAGAQFEVEAIDLSRQGQMSPEFLRINPKHRVPVLVIDGEPLTENVAIQLWIARQFPAAKLMPDDPMQYAKATSLLAWCSSGLHPTLTPNALPERFCSLPDTADNVKACAQKLLREYLAIADGLLAGRAWFFDHFTTVDAYFFWCLRRAMNFKIDVSAFTHCVAHHERMHQRTSVQQLLTFERRTMDRFARDR